MKVETKLKKAAHHISYEIWMYRETAKLLLRTDSLVLNNALLESFAVHIYNLYRFFYQGEVEIVNNSRRKRKDSDIIAEDFDIARNSFRKDRTPKKLISPIVEKRNKQIAHLTYNRIYRNKKTKPWSTGKISAMMEQTIAAFFNSLSATHQSYFQ